MDGLSESLLKGRFPTALPRGEMGKMTIFKEGLRQEGGEGRAGERKLSSTPTMPGSSSPAGHWGRGLLLSRGAQRRLPAPGTTALPRGSFSWLVTLQPQRGSGAGSLSPARARGGERARCRVGAWQLLLESSECRLTLGTGLVTQGHRPPLR